MQARELTNVFIAEDDPFPPLRAPTRQHSIASRYSYDQSRTSTPPVPPGFEAHVANENRRSTPSVPPGLSRPTALPDLEESVSRPTSRPSSRVSVKRRTSQILPALPLLPSTPSRVVTPSKPDAKDGPEKTEVVETPTKSLRIATPSDLKAAIPIEEHDVKDPAAIVDHPAKTNTEDNVKSEKNAPVTRQRDPAKAGNVSKKSTGKAAAEDTSIKDGVVEKKDSQKRKHPGKLDITAAINGNERANSDEPSAPADVAGGTRSSRISSGATPVTTSTKLSESPMPSPAIKAPLRTLRVVQTPKTEGPSAAGFSAPSMAAAVLHKTPSRQPSVSSIHPPGTPSSEHISMSDNISMASTSQSRANSPPPLGSKVGSAPVRAKTKSQQKKDRQERAKALEEEKAKVEEASKAPEEPVIEALVSRKKKSKREKEPKLPKAKAANPTAPAIANTTPTASRPPSPKPADETVKADISAVAAESKPGTPEHSPAPARPATQTSNEPSSPATPTLTTAQLISELRASAPELQKCVDNIFRVSHSHHMKYQPNIPHKDLLNHWQAEFKVDLKKEDVEALLNGKIPAFHYGGQDGRTFDRGVVTPTGAHLRALTKELEGRFLELEKRLRAMPEETRFRTAKPQNEIKFPSIDLEALKRQFENVGGRGVSVMEQMVQDGSTMKKGAFLVDESTRYINEFVMPPATPSASAANVRNQQAASGAHFVPSEQAPPSVEIAEKQMNEAKRHADERENALKKMMKKNKKLLGLN